MGLLQGLELVFLGVENYVMARGGGAESVIYRYFASTMLDCRCRLRFHGGVSSVELREAAPQTPTGALPSTEEPGELHVKYSVSIEIALPREKVVQLLSDPVHRPKWLRGLVLHEPLRGADGQVGTESRVVFQSGGRTMECTETVTRREPENLHGIPSDRVVHFDREIVAAGMWSAAREQITETGTASTLWVSENEYRFNGLIRLAAPFMRGVFIKQSRQHMQDFKSFAEHGTDVREAKD